MNKIYYITAILALMWSETSFSQVTDKGKTVDGSKSTPSKIRLSDCRIVLINEVTLAFDRSGIVKTLEFKEGQQVSVNETLCILDDAVAKASLAIAEIKAENESDLKYQRAARDLAEYEWTRSRDANKKAFDERRGAPVPVSEVEKLKLAFEKARYAVEQAEHESKVHKLEAEAARCELFTYSVQAKFDGVITRIYKKRGEAIRQGEPIIDLVNTDRVRVEGRVPLVQVRYFHQGDLVRVRLSVPEIDLPEEKEEFEGRITFVDPTSNLASGEPRIFAEVTNRNNILRAGLMAEMTLDIKDGSHYAAASR